MSDVDGDDEITNLARRIAMARPRWMDKAECQGRDDLKFFDNVKSRVARAKATCEQCRVKVECLDYAVTNEIADGLWGGKTEDERKAMAGG